MTSQSGSWFVGDMLLWACLPILLLIFSALIGWANAYAASIDMPEDDARRRPDNEKLSAAALLLNLQLPVSDDDIRRAKCNALPSTPGDTFADGTLKSLKMADIFDAADLLMEANAYDANPPFEAHYLLAYWEYRAGFLGRFWARHFPPPIVRALRTDIAPGT